MADTQFKVSDQKTAKAQTAAAIFPESMRASQDEVEAIEKSYWKRTLRDVLKDWRLYVMTGFGSYSNFDFAKDKYLTTVNTTLNLTGFVAIQNAAFARMK